LSCGYGTFPPFQERNQTCSIESTGPFCKPYLNCNSSGICDRIYSNETCIKNGCGDDSLTCIEGFCRPKSFLTFGQACNETYQCMSMTCNNGVCENLPTSSPCTSNGQCTNGATCVNNVCNVYECSADDQCPLNTFCHGQTCQKRVDKGSVCNSNIFCKYPYACAYENSTSTLKTCIEPLSLDAGARCDYIEFTSHFHILQYPCNITKGLFCSSADICSTYVQTNDTCQENRKCTYTEVCDCDSYTSPSKKVCKPIVKFTPECSKEVAIVNECIINNTVIMTSTVTEIAFSPLYEHCGTKLCELNSQCFILPSSSILYYCDNYYPPPPETPAPSSSSSSTSNSSSDSNSNSSSNSDSDSDSEPGSTSSTPTTSSTGATTTTSSSTTTSTGINTTTGTNIDNPSNSCKLVISFTSVTVLSLLLILF